MTDSIDIWVIRYQWTDGHRRIAWSNPYHAQEFLEWELPVQLSWREEKGGDRLIATAESGEMLAVVERIQLADPVRFSEDYLPEELAPSIVDPEW